MKQDIAVKWAAALRSGQYSQAKSWLFESEDGEITGYCCLGVLCDLYQRETGHTIIKECDLGFSALGEPAVLPETVQSWAGMRTANGHLGDLPVSLSQANDAGKTFNEIAAIIDRHQDIL